MSESLLSTVLKIENAAEAILVKAGLDAKAAVADARSRREADGRAYLDAIKLEVGKLEEAAAAERDQKIRELTAAGESALSAVRNISDAAFDNGVQHVMRALAGK